MNTMDSAVFKSKTSPEDKYAVGVRVEGGGVMMIETYKTLDMLEDGYKHWYSYALTRQATSPVPIEIVDKSFKCRVLKSMIRKLEDTLTGKANTN